MRQQRCHISLSLCRESSNGKYARFSARNGARYRLLKVPRRGNSRGIWYAWHGLQLGGGSPLWGLVAPTTSRGQLRRREAGWEGSRRQNRDLRNTNRILGGMAWASRPNTAKPDATYGLSRRCGGCARKVAGLIQGGLCGCPGCPIALCVFVGWCGTARVERLLLAMEKSAEVVVPAGSLVSPGRTEREAERQAVSARGWCVDRS